MLSRHRKAGLLLAVVAAVAATSLAVAVSLVDGGGGGGQVTHRQGRASIAAPASQPPSTPDATALPGQPLPPTPDATALPGQPLPPTPAATASPGQPPPPATTGLVAVLHGATSVSGSPGGPVRTTLAATTFGSATAAPVVAQATGWVEIRLPGDGSPTGWVPTGNVTVEVDPWAVTVSLSSRTITIFDAGHAVLTAPVATGLPATPTPTGVTYIAGDVAASGVDGGIVGPFPARPTGLSSTVPAVQDAFPGGVIALHGWGPGAQTDPALWTPDGHGLPASHGCLRVQVAVAQLLATIPNGTPLEVSS